MSDGQEQRIYQAVRALLEQMTPEMRTQAEALLVRAERGENTAVDLLKLVRTDKKLGEALAGGSRLVFPANVTLPSAGA